MFASSNSKMMVVWVFQCSPLNKRRKPAKNAIVVAATAEMVVTEEVEVEIAEVIATDRAASMTAVVAATATNPLY
jgi:hypothetical protein